MKSYRVLRNDGGGMPEISRPVAEEHGGRIELRGDDEEGSHVINDGLVAHMEEYPWRWAPQNPHYVKTPGTVRQWFRAMRAADFERVAGAPNNTTSVHDLVGIIGPIAWPWNLFDTQTVVDRETAAHYATLTTIYFVQDGRVVGSIENVLIERSAYAPLVRRGDPATDPGAPRGPLP
jgi:hypothetical protein